jgi:hypothetical protein
VENSLTFEKYLLENRSVLHDKTNIHWFQLAGRWLAHFHKVSSLSELTTIGGQFVLNDLRKKWLSHFPEPQKMEDKFRRVMDSINGNSSLPCSLSKMHREYGPGNILLAGPDLYGIDFGNQETAPPYDDISYFVIACTTLNSFPHHPCYQKIPLAGREIREFIQGYLDHYPFTKTDLLSDKLFVLFLWKNLIRRISGKLTKADRFPVLFRSITRSYLIDLYRRMEAQLLNMLYLIQ